MLAALLPVSALAAPGGQPRNYIVMLSVADAGAAIDPSNRSARQRIRRRADRTGAATDRLTARYGFKTSHRYSRALSGFSARLTPQEAAIIARDSSVASIRPALRFRIAAQVVPVGIKRIKAEPAGGPTPDVDIDVAILDTGIGPVGGNELNVPGGINCADDPQDEDYDADLYTDQFLGKHGTHVAGTIGARNNGIGTVGVAPGARLWSVRVIDRFGFGDEATVVCGLDWAVGTHSTAAPDIDLINISLEGPRADSRESCPVDGNDPLYFTDPIHAAVCAAHAADITMVVAAGNRARNARNTSPAGYDQVITVGALSDFDGQGWGNATTGTCNGYHDEGDDTYASYSNYGRDVDILAPGTCVRSTTTGTGDGKATKVMTGTSMATPHVTGAVARYLAAHPATTPDKMRKIVRASGRMDWNAKSDPFWSGVKDDDQPNRVLDVTALTGPDDVKVWLFHDGFKLGVGDKKRTTRVDVQRLGGYAGDVTLDLSGLPAGVGSDSFGQSSLSGLNGLGTNLDLQIKANGTEGAYELSVRARGGGGVPSGSRTLDLVVDRTGPALSNVGSRLRGGQVGLAVSGAAQTYIQWQATDALSQVKQTLVRRKPGTQAWRIVGASNGSSYTVSLKPGQQNKFKVKATDSLGNTTLSAAFTARLSVRDSKSLQWIRPASGGWMTKSAKKAFGGSLLLATGPADSLSTSFTGKAVAVVAPVGPNRGTLRVRVDGGDWREVDLTASKGAQKRVVFSRRVENGPHVIEVQGYKDQTALDAILIIR